MTKQDYVIKRLQDDEVIVQGNPKVYKALKEELGKVLAELKRIEAGKSVDTELLRVIEQIATIMDGMRKE